jgi:hypothetical protein
LDTTVALIKSQKNATKKKKKKKKKRREIKKNISTTNQTNKKWKLKHAKERGGTVQVTA